MRPVLVFAIPFLAALVFVGPSRAADSISPADAIQHVGEHTRVCGTVASAKFAASSRRQPTFLNLDEPYPHQVFTALVWGSDRSAFPYAPESLKGRRICVSGTIQLYKGKPEIVVSTPSQIETDRG